MISVSHLTKRFRLYRSPSDRLREIFSGQVHHTDFRALDDVSFEIRAGESLGIVGPNGAGKSTLLKIMAGSILPDSGSVRLDVPGRIGMLAIGAGFDMSLSGMENIRLSGLLLGMSSVEIETRRQAIIDFTELGEFIHEPVKTYSTGMLMRLGFSIAIHSQPACFIVDEALSVGDAYFSSKCQRKISDFRASGGSIILVSHDMNAIRMLTDRAVLLHRGRLIEDGAPEAVTNSYNFLLAKMADEADPQRKAVAEIKREDQSSFGNFQVRIDAAAVIGEDSKGDQVTSGEQTRIELIIRVGNLRINAATIGIMIRDRFGQTIFGTNTHLMGCQQDLEANKAYRYTFFLRMDLGIGKYSLTAAVHSGRDHVQDCYHWFDNISRFQVAGIKGKEFVGIARLYPDCRIETVE